MSSYNPVLPQDVLLAIGQRFKVECDDIAEPVPPRLTALLKLLEMDQQSGSSALSADHLVASRGDDDAHFGSPISAADTMHGSISTPAP
jgi:hypothetical protein